MQDKNAAQLLAKVMGWREPETFQRYAPELQLLADYKYDHYQRFGPGKRFIESLALWLHQFDPDDRVAALQLVTQHLVFFSDAEVSHLVTTAYSDLIVQERVRLVAEEYGIPTFRVGEIFNHQRYEELRLKSLYLGLSDGARTNELRRASNDGISNEQIWQAYELGEAKSKDMLDELSKALARARLEALSPKFNIVWLLDDFSGSGNTYIRYDSKAHRFKGKLKKIYDVLHRESLVNSSHYEVFLLLYIATQQAIDHIQYWADRFTSENAYKPLQVRVLCLLGKELALKPDSTSVVGRLLGKTQYFDPRVARDPHIAVGGADGRMGFANCALPVVLAHNTPNNSIYLLWGPENYSFFGLFPRISRHRDF